MIPAGLYLADTSALARVRHPAVNDRLQDLGRRGLLATCVTVDLEVLYSARSPQEYTEIRDRRRDAFVSLPLNDDIGARALAIQADLAKTSQHRGAGIIDLITAAIAEHYAAIVLHYDADFDLVARATGQPVEWVVPAGAVT